MRMKEEWAKECFRGVDGKDSLNNLRETIQVIRDEFRQECIETIKRNNDEYYPYIYKEGLTDLIKDIEKNEGYQGGVLSKAKKAGWNKMNCFTHSGFSQVVRRNTESSIEPNYDPEEIKEAMDFTNAIGLLTSLELSFLTKNEALSLEILEKTKEIKIP